MSKHPKRRLKNYLLEPRFQLKYTGMVVAVTLVVASALGVVAYRESSALSESTSMMMYDQGADDAEVMAYVADYDRSLKFSIIGGIAILCLVLGATGIIVTHRMVGPSFRMRWLFRQVGEGRVHVAGRLRKGDELQTVFDAFAEMIEKLREFRSEELEQLRDAINHARETGADAELLAKLDELEQGLEKRLEQKEMEY